MTPQRGEIYLVRARWSDSSDFRPCVIVRVESDGRIVVVSLISAAMDLYNRQWHFYISKLHPDFKATGLRKDSYCSGEELPHISVNLLGKRLGRLEGELARAFDAWIG